MEMYPAPEFVKQQLNKKCKVIFTKKDGTERTMICTRNLDTVPEKFHPVGGGPNFPDNQIRVFDLEKEEWRSFRVESIVYMEQLPG